MFTPALKDGRNNKWLTTRAQLDPYYAHAQGCTQVLWTGFPEPTCLLVSTKTRSSGIINKLVPRALVSFAFKI